MPHPDTETSVALDVMEKEDLIRGLMRGDKATFKQGYSVPAAMSAVETLHDLGDAERVELTAFAMGFYLGLREGGTGSTNPA